MKKVPYVHSNFPRKKDDNYKTIDERCVYGFLEYIKPSGLCIDVCSPDGSGIIDTLTQCGYYAVGLPDAFKDNISADWIITNPPYTRLLVDKIILRQIERVKKGEVYGVAMLLRSNFDFAKSRDNLFKVISYAGQIKLRFRPWWSNERKYQPIHNYCWHLWKTDNINPPQVFYANGIVP